MSVTGTRSNVRRTMPLTQISTAMLLGGLVLTWFALNSNHAVGIFSSAAIGLGLTLCLATGIEAGAGIRNLIRVDILSLWMLYALTLLEFLFPQLDVDAVVSPEAATNGTYAVFLGFAGLAVG